MTSTPKPSTGAPANPTRRHGRIDTVCGPVVVVADGGDVIEIRFDGRGSGTPVHHEIGPLVESSDDPLVASALAQLGEYFAGERQRFDLPLRADGDPFAQGVWTEIAAVPYGETTSYGAIARALGDVGLSRAVGSATGRNPISIVVPCHRVIGSTGKLVGYASGLDRKVHLLDLEERVAGSTLRLF